MNPRSGEYTSGCSGPAASHLSAPPSPCHEGYAGQAPRPPRLNRLLPDPEQPESDSKHARDEHRVIVRAEELRRRKG